MSPLAFYNGSATLVVVSCFFAFGYLMRLAGIKLARENIRWTAVLDVPQARLLVGNAVMNFAFAWGSLVFWPTFPMIIAGREDLLASYTVFASPAAEMSNWLTVIALAIMGRPLFEHLYGWSTGRHELALSDSAAAIGCLAFVAALVYLGGAWGTMAVAGMM